MARTAGAGWKAHEPTKTQLCQGVAYERTWARPSESNLTKKMTRSRTGHIPVIQPPKDPLLRAIWRVRCADLSPTEQLALLALGRVLKNGAREIGASLLAALLNIPVGTAKNILTTLRAKGFITSDGTFSRQHHRRATRSLTAKGRASLGQGRSSTGDRKARSSASDRRSPANDRRRSSTNAASRSPANAIDLGVGQGAALSRPPIGGQAATGGKKARHTTQPGAEVFPAGPTVSIADIMCPPNGDEPHRKNGRAKGSTP